MITCILITQGTVLTWYTRYFFIMSKTMIHNVSQNYELSFMHRSLNSHITLFSLEVIDICYALHQFQTWFFFKVNFHYIVSFLILRWKILFWNIVVFPWLFLWTSRQLIFVTLSQTYHFYNEVFHNLEKIRIDYPMNSTHWC